MYALAIDSVTLSALPCAHYWLIILELDLSDNVMSFSLLITQLTVNSVEQWHIF
jgi:hypothetical protein